MHHGPSIRKATNNASIKAITAKPKAIWPNNGFRVTQKTRLIRMAIEKSTIGEKIRTIRSRDFQRDISYTKSNMGVLLEVYHLSLAITPGVHFTSMMS